MDNPTAIKSRIGVNINSGHSELLNMETLSHSGIKRISYRTLRGFIKKLRTQNKRCKKLGVSARFDITLPIVE